MRKDKLEDWLRNEFVFWNQGKRKYLKLYEKNLVASDKTSANWAEGRAIQALRTLKKLEELK